MDLIIAVVSAAFMGLAIYFLIATMRSFAPWIPSKSSMVEKALSSIQPKNDSHFIDLGCGDGRIVFLAYRLFHIPATGIEISPLPYLLAQIRRLRYWKAPITIRNADLYTVPLNPFDIIFVYGLPKPLAEKLEPKLEREARPGSWVISYNFSLKNKKPLMEFHEQWRNCYIYRY